MADAALSPEAPATETDGRRRRSQRSRERILEAVCAAISWASGPLTAELIAERAGLSSRTIFRHFGDMEGLADAMRARVGAQAARHLDPGGFTGGIEERVRELVRRRVAVFEVVGPLRTIQLEMMRGSAVARELDRGFARACARQLDAALGADLGKARNPMTRRVIGLLLSLESWLHLRRGEQLTGRQTRELLAAALLAQLRAGGGA